MQRLLTFQHRHEEEEIKDAGLHLDFDEIAKKGTMSKEEASIAKWFGIYGSRQAGNHMARVVVAGGVMTSTQARILSRISEKFAQGKLAVTTRQSVQLHWLKTPALPDMMRALAEVGLTTFHGCGDVNRNVAACPLAETCQYRRLNVLPDARKISEFMADSRDLDNLPRKFKITLSGCGAGCGQPYINCIGIVAVQREGAKGPETGYKVIIGGGMGWKAFKGEEVFSFVPQELIHNVCRAVGIVYRDHGDRRDRNKSRMKYVVHRNGIDQCRKWIIEALKKEGIETHRLESDPFEETGVAYPARPLTVDDPVGTDGRVTCRAIIPKGELTSPQMKRLAEITEIFGNKRLYTTNRQNIEIHGVQPAQVDACKAEIEKLGFKTGGSFTLTDIVPCVGTTYCPLAVSKTRDMYDMLMELVSQDKYVEIRDKAIINITGCPNSCSPFRIADIGLRGMRIREQLGSVEGYEILLGGTHDQFGQKLGEFKTEDCVKVIESVLDKFKEIREGDETLAECVRRTGFGS